MSAGPPRLQHAIKTLRIRWADARSGWNDAVSAEFEENHLAAFDAQSVTTIRAMQKLEETLGKMRRDCDRDRD